MAIKVTPPIRRAGTLVGGILALGSSVEVVGQFERGIGVMGALTPASFNLTVPIIGLALIVLSHWEAWFGDKQMLFAKAEDGIVWKKWSRSVNSPDAPRGYCGECDGGVYSEPGKKVACQECGKKFMLHDTYNKTKEKMRGISASDWNNNRRGWVPAPTPDEQATIPLPLFIVLAAIALSFWYQQRRARVIAGDSMPYISPVASWSGGDLIKFRTRMCGKPEWENEIRFFVCRLPEKTNNQEVLSLAPHEVFTMTTNDDVVFRGWSNSISLSGLDRFFNLKGVVHLRCSFRTRNDNGAGNGSIMTFRRNGSGWDFEGSAKNKAGWEWSATGGRDACKGPPDKA